MATVYPSLFVQILKHLLQDYEVGGAEGVLLQLLCGCQCQLTNIIKKTHYNIPVVIFTVRISCFRPGACQPVSSDRSAVCFKFFGLLFVCFGHLPAECQF